MKQLAELTIYETLVDNEVAVKQLSKIIETVSVNRMNNYLLWRQVKCFITNGKGNIRHGSKAAAVNCRFSHWTGQLVTKLQLELLKP